MTVLTNLQVQKLSNKKPLPGDIFSLKLPGDTFIFGRVIGADLPSGRAPMPGAYLLYIYSDRRDEPTVELSALRPPRLLIPPGYTNRMLWTKGYAVTLGHVELTSADLLPQHCFHDVIFGKYRDENGATLPEKHEPCGSWGLASYRKFDDLISDRLGIPRVPIDPGERR